MSNLKITLEVLKELVIANTNVKPEIKKVYIDYGSRWMEYTLVASSPTDSNISYQMLSPRDIMDLNKGIFTVEDAQNFIDEINKRGW